MSGCNSMVESVPSKHLVAGSSPVIRSTFGTMELYDEIIKAGWAKDGDDALSLLIHCLISVNGTPMELEDFDKFCTPGDTLTLYKPFPSLLNPFKVTTKEEYIVKGVS